MRCQCDPPPSWSIVNLTWSIRMNFRRRPTGQPLPTGGIDTTVPPSSLCSQFPSLVINYDDLVARPKVVLAEVVESLLSLGIATSGDTSQAVDFIESLDPEQDVASTESESINSSHRTLARLLNRLDGQGMGVPTGDAGIPDLVDITAEFYDGITTTPVTTSQVCPTTGAGGLGRLLRSYCGQSGYDVTAERRARRWLCCGHACRGSPYTWRGCTGIDISSWAIEQVPDALKPFCTVSSLTEEIDGHYDLITCIEVMEHVPASLADEVIANLRRHDEMVLFSSTPDGFDEPTRLDVEPTTYGAVVSAPWVRAGLRIRHNIPRQACGVFRRMEVGAGALVEGFEQMLWRTNTEDYGRLRDAVAEHDRLSGIHTKLVIETDAVVTRRDSSSGRWLRCSRR